MNPETTTWNMAIPFIGPLNNLRELLNTVEPDLLPHFCITDNSRQEIVRVLQLESSGVRVHYAPENDGISRGWNRALREGCDMTFICSASMRFPMGLRKVINELLTAANPFGVDASHSFHFIGIGKASVDAVGYFDENFYPAYYEDTDFWERLKLAGINLDGHRLPKIGTSAICVGDGIALKSGVIKCGIDFSILERYFRQKWGGLAPNERKFTHPFNDPANPLSYWPPITVEDSKKRYGLQHGV